MIALGWDDVPEDYFDDLKTHLADFQIELVIEKDPGKIPGLLQKKGRHWDLVITDLLDDSKAVQDGKPLGVWIVKQATDAGLPVYVITKEPTHQKIEHLVGQVPIISKITPPGFAAAEIKRDLKRRGFWIDTSMVFLIRGHDRNSGEVSDLVDAKLRQWGLKVEEVSGENPTNNILASLLEKMRDCAGVIAVCTPDDEVFDPIDKSHYQPRQNVLMEIGMAMGLNRGLQKLIILQRWDPRDPEKQARLPSNVLGGIPIRFSSDVKAVFPALRDGLRRAGVAIPEKD